MTMFKAKEAIGQIPSRSDSATAAISTQDRDIKAVKGTNQGPTVKGVTKIPSIKLSLQSHRKPDKVQT